MGAFDDILATPAPPISGPRTGTGGGSFDDLLQDTVAKTPVLEDDKRAARIEAIKKAVQASSAPASTLNSINTRIGDAGSFSAVRPIGAAISAAASGVTGDHPGSTFGERFQGYYGAASERADQASKDLGLASIPLDIAASVPATIATGGTGVVAPAKNALTSAGTGFIQGASQNAESVPGAIWGGVKQGATDAATTMGLNKVISKFTGSGKQAADDAAKAVRGVDPKEIEKNAKALYTQLDNQGIRYSDRQFRGIVQDLQQAQARSELRLGDKLVPGPHAGVTDIVAKLDEYSKAGGATFNQLHDLRVALSKQARGSSEDARDAANIVISRLDNLIHNHAPAVNPTKADVGALHKEASKLWRAKSLVEDTAYVADKTARNLEWKGGNPDKATRGAFARVQDRVSKPDAYDPFDPEGRKLLAEIVSGTKGQNRRANWGEIARTNAPALGVGAAGLAGSAGLLKGVDPTSSGISSLLVGAPVTLSARYLGRQGQKSADKIGQENVNKLMRQITTGTTDLPEYASKLGRDELAKLQFNQLLARMAPKAAGYGPEEDQTR